jgi:hypothetical protein
MLRVPFSPGEVAALNRWQRIGWVHPYTCPNRDDGQHASDAVLMATVRGWICPYCSHTQDWAAEYMVTYPEPPESILVGDDDMQAGANIARQRSERD